MNNTVKLGKIHICPKCVYRWVSRVEDPVSCPRCHKRLDTVKTNG